jgi:uncharacterized membrane protein YfcA
MQFLSNHAFLLQFSTTELIYTALVFTWAGFVRSGMGFGGAALGLPLMLFIHDQPLFWLPVIGFHLLFFSGLTLGVFGLLNLPNQWVLVFIYSITLFYAFLWLTSINIHSNKPWVDKVLLICGGYIAGTALTGAPLMVAVYMRNVAKSQLRNTLFVLWFTLVTIKMTTFAVLNVDLHFFSALLLLPVAAIGHVIGLKTHDLILSNDEIFKRFIGGILVVICLMGLLYL